MLKLHCRIKASKSYELARWLASYMCGLCSRHSVTATCRLSWEESSELLCWLYCQTTPVSRCMSAWCPTCNTPGIFRLCSRGSRLPVHVRCLINILAFFADSAMILVLLHIWPKALSIICIVRLYVAVFISFIAPACSLPSELRTLPATYYCITVLWFL